MKKMNTTNNFINQNIIHSDYMEVFIFEIEKILKLSLIIYLLGVEEGYYKV